MLSSVLVEVVFFSREVLTDMITSWASPEVKDTIGLTYVSIVLPFALSANR